MLLSSPATDPGEFSPMSDSRRKRVGSRGYGVSMFSRTPTQAPPEYLTRVDSPLGRLELTSDGTAITSLSIERDGSLPFEELDERSTEVLELAARQLAEYFAGTRTRFELPLSTHGT